MRATSDAGLGLPLHALVPLSARLPLSAVGDRGSNAGISGRGALASRPGGAAPQASPEFMADYNGPHPKNWNNDSAKGIDVGYPDKFPAARLEGRSASKL